MSGNTNNGPMLKAAGLWAKSSVKGGQYLTGRLGGVKVLILENRERQSDDDPSHHLFFAEAPDRRQGAGERPQERSGGAGALTTPDASERISDAHATLPGASCARPSGAAASRRSGTGQRRPRRRAGVGAMTAGRDRVFPELKHDDEVRRGGGRPPHRPTEQDRAKVKAMSAYGIPQEQIARVFDIDSKTLRLHYRNELDLGVIEANAAVAKTLFQQAVGGNITAVIWWTKTRMGWREKQEIEYSGTITVASALTAATERLKRLGDGAQGKEAECTQLNGSECAAINGSECDPDKPDA